MTRRRVTIVIASIVFAIAIGEVGLRLGARWIFNDTPIMPDETLGWVLEPNYAGWAIDEGEPQWVTINSAGFRDRERTLEPAPGTLRIAVIGDSFIHGYFLPLEQNFPAVLEQKVATCARRPVETLSFGVLQYNTTQELLTYQLHASRYAPKIVVLAVYPGNDVLDNHPKLSSEPAPRYILRGDDLILDPGFRSFMPDPPRYPWRRDAYEFARRHSRSVQLAQAGMDGAREWLRSEPSSAGPEVAVNPVSTYQPPTQPELVEAWRLTELVLLKFAREVAAQGAEFWIATVFNGAQVDPDVTKRRELERELGVGDLFYAEHRIAAFGAANGIPVVPLAEPVAAITAARGVYANGTNANSPVGRGHWNELGARVSAEMVGDRLCAESKALGPRQ